MKHIFIKIFFLLNISLISVYANVQLIKKENNDSNTTLLVIGGIHGDEPGGYFSVQLKEKYPHGPEEEVLKESDYGYEYERFFSYYTLPEVEELFRQCGLKVLSAEVTEPTKTRWILVLGQK